MSGSIGGVVANTGDAVPGANDPPFDVFSRACPSRPVLEHVTGRWGSLVLAALREGPIRFNDLRRRVDGVSQKVLAQTLQALERDGFLTRHQLSVFPLRVEYTLTSAGQDVAAKLLELIAQIEASMDSVLASRQHYDSDAADGHTSRP
jgi:DNA-binding HxlR family transcriptional regulator